MDSKKRLQDIILQFSEHGLSELEFEIPDFKVRLVKENPIYQAALPLQNTEVGAAVQNFVVEAPSQRSEALSEQELAPSACDEIRSTLVGTVYLSSAPGEEAFVSEGKTVKKGETLCIIEAMKIMNEFCAPYDLVIKNICAENGAMVQYDEILFEVEKC